MGTKKGLAALAICCAVLWGSRFGPYTCAAVAGYPTGASSAVVAILASGFLLTMFLFVPVYDLIAFLTYKLGWETSFDRLVVYPGDSPAPNAQPIPLKTMLLLFYPLDLAAAVFLLLPAWTKVAYCG